MSSINCIYEMCFLFILMIGYIVIFWCQLFSVLFVHLAPLFKFKYSKSALVSQALAMQLVMHSLSYVLTTDVVIYLKHGWMHLAAVWCWYCASSSTCSRYWFLLAATHAQSSGTLNSYTSLSRSRSTRL